MKYANARTKEKEDSKKKKNLKEESREENGRKEG